MDLAQLSASIRAYAENSFPETLAAVGLTSTQQINTFITLAEQRIFNTVQLLDLRKNVTGNCTAGVKYLSVPSDWLSNFSLAVIDPETGDYDYLLNKDVNFIRESFRSPSDDGKPTHYSFFDQNSYLLGPTPDQPYAFELHYFYYPQSITETLTGRSWLGDNFDTVLLSGALLEAAIFMKSEADVVQTYTARYEEALGLLKQLGEGRNREDAYRSGQVRYPPR